MAAQADAMVATRRARRAGRVTAYLLLIVGALAFVLPFLWMVSTALKGDKEVVQYPPDFLPTSFHWGNFVAAWQALPFNTFLMNSAIITVASVIGSVVFSTMSAYAFARLRARWRPAMFGLMLATMMIPGEVIVVPDFILFNKLRLVNTFWPIILPMWFGNAFFIFLLRQFISTIPPELDEAARIDGAGHLRILFRILVPQMKPAIATVTVFSFIFSWNNFLYPLIYLRDQSKYTMPLGLQLFVSSQYITKYNQMMAISLLMLLPVVILFLIAQRAFIRGVTLTGLGGR
jgi:multiple sugar transport system permease protein